MSPNDCPFCGILNGSEEGTIITRDDDKQFALIANIHPEAAVHWLAVPFEHIESTETLELVAPGRFLDLIEFAVAETKAQKADYPMVQGGFTIKFHFGAYETVPHAKLHVLCTE